MARSSNTDAMETDGGDASISVIIERNPPESRLLELDIKSPSFKGLFSYPFWWAVGHSLSLTRR
ncbi:hypothetical protein QJS10_CPB12g00854 [Acorus calamus]|uniref:Uncharacterized protein n=1 Tax=Acorus calamus TaxID=4465 RepID=A0AAV9DM42_ACOCL|nr:hypothetical protein QJS10_CPB12g00854 [Acorus calamus]